MSQSPILSAIMIGPIPGDDLGCLVKLTSLSMHSNRFRGPIPRELSKLQKLSTLDLSRNARLQGFCLHDWCVGQTILLCF